MPDDEAAARSAPALRAEQVRLYAASLPASVGGHALVAVLTASVLWGAVATGTLLAWLACLALAVAVRAGVPRLSAGDTPGPARDRRALRHVRLAVIGTGVVWGLAGALLFPQPDLQLQVFVAFVLAGMAAGSLTLTAFDLPTAFVFAGLTLSPLSMRLAASGAGEQAAMAAMVLLFAAFLGLAGARTYRNLRETMAMRAADAARTEAIQRSEQRLQQLSEQLERKTEALELTLDSMAQGILSLDADGRINFHNRRLVELTDLPESFLAQRPTMSEVSDYQVAHGHFGADLELLDEAARTALRRWNAGEKVPFPPEYFRRTPSGRVLEVKSRYHAGGGLVRTFTDVTAYFDAQARLEDSEAQSRKLALVAAHTDNAVFIADARLRIEWVNDGFTRLTGYRIDEIGGRHPSEFLHGPDTDLVAVQRLRADLARDGHASGELVNYTRDGRAFWSSIELFAIRGDDGQVRQHISISGDVTERRRAEAALRAARDEAERANQAKSDFLSSMSHELRTPMNAILGFGQLLELDPGDALSDQHKRYVHEILRAGGHLLELINDVLDLARIEAGKQQIAVEPVAVRALLDDCLGLMQPVARARGIELPDRTSFDCACHVLADRTRLKQVLLNLLSNAIKYNRAAGRVTLTCRCGSGTARIGVGDTGQGLSIEQRERLFTAFDRLGAEDGAIEGAGLGLVLSKRLVELMGGSIGVDSEVGRGSEFWIRLPMHMAGAATATLAAPPVPPPAEFDGRHSVLYIEDNEVNVMLMHAMLARAPGLRLITAPLPGPGLEMARAERPDLILLDIQLPGMDGYEVMRRLRADPATAAIPVIAVSANAMPQDIEQGLAAGFSAYLTKPLDLSRLLDALRATLGDVAISG